MNENLKDVMIMTDKTKPHCKPVLNDKGEVYKYEYVCFKGKIYGQFNTDDGPYEIKPEMIAKQFNVYSNMVTENISDQSKIRRDILTALGYPADRVIDLLVEHGWEDDECEEKDSKV